MTTISDVLDSPSTHPSTWLHLGLGAFHRAHQAAYLQALMDLGDARWRIVAGNIRPDAADVSTHIAAQGFYTLETIDAQGAHAYQTIRAITHALPYEPNLAGLVAVGAHSQTALISFTVTEAGYYLDEQDALDVQAPELARDAQGLRDSVTDSPFDYSSSEGYTLYGALVCILRARMHAGGAPVTLLNCDNLRHNGTRFRAGLLAFIRHLDDAVLAAWVERCTTCPNAMVDRITPRPSPDVRARVLSATGVDDAAALMSEAFCQWVVQDDFCAQRPEWERVGVQMVDSVLPYEEAKIRILNATHSCIAWACVLKGYAFIHQGAQDPAIVEIARSYITDAVIPCLAPSPLDLAIYRDMTLSRFANAALKDTVARVSMDSFAKIPGYIAPTVRDCIDRGVDLHAVAMLPALFLHFLHRWHQQTLPFPYEDQAMSVAKAQAICRAHDAVAALCADVGLWGSVANHPDWLRATQEAFARVPTRLRV